ncbi:MAG: OmpW/AlkL family protein [Luteimonas sp.]
MSSLHNKLAIAATLALAASPAAFAQDAFAQDSDSNYGGKRVSIVGGATLLQPHHDPATGIDIDGDPAPTLSATYHIDDNWGVELWGAVDKFNHRVRGPEGKIGSIDQQPIALSGQYHFGQPDMTFRPFVGLGLYESNISNEDISQGGNHVGLDTPRGAIGTVGVDLNINPTWFARADARYMRSRADVNVAGQPTGEELKLDPWTVGIGLGARF